MGLTQEQITNLKGTPLSTAQLQWLKDTYDATPSDFAAIGQTTPNTQFVAPTPAGTQVGSLQGTMTTPTPPSNPPAPTPPAGSPPASGVQGMATPGQPTGFQNMPLDLFGNAMNEIRTKLGNDEDLMQQKAVLLKQVYDTKPTDAEMQNLTPSQRTAIMSGNRQMIDMEIRLINDEIKGRSNTLDSSINYITDVYKTEQQQQEQQLNDARATVLSFVQQYGSQAGEALKSLYGPEMLDKLKAMGIDIDQFASFNAPTLTEQKNGNGAGSYTINIPTDSGNQKNQLAARNNNPGNLKFANQDGATLGAGGYAKFETPEAGYQALIKQIQLDQTRNETLAGFITKYAPPTENDTAKYIQDAVTKLGVPATSKLADLDTSDLADFIMQKESGSTREMTETDTQVNADSIVSGLTPPPNPAAARSSVAQQKLFAELSRRKFDTGKAYLQWIAATKVVQALNGPQLVKFRGLAESVVNTIDEVNTLADQIKNSGVIPLNKAKLEAYVKLNGNSKYGQLATNYLTAVNTLKEEFANLATGGYAPTDSAWTLANSQINADYGVDQLKGSLTEVQRLINYRVNAIENVQPIIPGQMNTPSPTPAGSASDDPVGIRNLL